MSMYIMKPWYRGADSGQTTTFATYSRFQSFNTASSASSSTSSTNYFLNNYKSIYIGTTSWTGTSGAWWSSTTYSSSQKGFGLTIPKLVYSDIIRGGSLFNKFSTNATIVDLRANPDIDTYSHSKSTSDGSPLILGAKNNTISYQANPDYYYMYITGQISSETESYAYRSKTLLLSTDRKLDYFTTSLLYNQLFISRRWAIMEFCFNAYLDIKDPSKLTFVVMDDLRWQYDTESKMKSVLSKTLTMYRATLSQA